MRVITSSRISSVAGAMPSVNPVRNRIAPSAENNVVSAMRLLFCWREKWIWRCASSCRLFLNSAVKLFCKFWLIASFSPPRNCAVALSRLRLALVITPPSR